jgi:hypothetical protein
MRHRWLTLVSLFAVLSGLGACEQFRQIKKQSDAVFGDQNFKSAIALIELYKVRYGVYPDRLADIKFTGQWDKIYLSGVTYIKLADGYELDLVRGWVGRPGTELSYPSEFWQGLGLRKSNVKRSGGA